MKYFLDAYNAGVFVATAAGNTIDQTNTTFIGYNTSVRGSNSAAIGANAVGNSGLLLLSERLLRLLCL